MTTRRAVVVREAVLDARTVVVIVKNETDATSQTLLLPTSVCPITFRYPPELPFVTWLFPTRTTTTTQGRRFAGRFSAANPELKELDEVRALLETKQTNDGRRLGYGRSNPNKQTAHKS